MDWLSVVYFCIVSVGSFLAATLEVLGQRHGFRVGLAFLKYGLLTIIGGFLAFSVIILTAILNPWWTLFIVLVVGWGGSQLIASIFRKYSQIISLLFIVLGIIILIIHYS